MVLLHRKGCALSPSHVKRDFNQLSDELTHPDYQGLNPECRLRVTRLLSGCHLLHLVLEFDSF